MNEMSIEWRTHLNLACGPRADHRFPPPWLNVDVAGPAAERHCDVRRLPADWTDHFETVRASHVLEHLFLNEMDAAIAEWVRVLKPGGELLVAVPDLERVLAALTAGEDARGRPALSLDGTTAALAQVYGIGYDSPSTESRWRHRFVFKAATLAELLGRHPGLTGIRAYAAADDPASRLGIRDDSQNSFTLCMRAVKRNAAPVNAEK